MTVLVDGIVIREPRSYLMRSLLKPVTIVIVVVTIPRALTTLILIACVAITLVTVSLIPLSIVAVL
jgi:hypothetical protein